ncbi:OmpA family protein [Phenylobacterium sp.]|uniref:OmpA family protein n=1 Tax=Phenylobacterium sp. TaxID=1871053 RepID=UPI002F3EB59F
MRTQVVVGVAALGAVVALAGCAGLSGRDRIVQRAPACPDQRVQIYFEPDSAVVTDEGRAVLAQAAQAARGCAVKDVKVLGLADAVGAPDANLQLSRRRADAVTAALAATGLPAAEFEVAGAGQAGAVTPTGEAQPLRRRADVVVYLERPK